MRGAFRTCLSGVLALALLYTSNAQPQKIDVKHNKVRVHFIAADEIAWDYAPSGLDQAVGRIVTFWLCCWPKK